MNTYRNRGIDNNDDSAQTDGFAPARQSPEMTIAHNTKLTEEDVRQIRREAARGRPRRSIAQAYSIGKVTVDRIVRRDSFAWVPNEEGHVMAEQWAQDLEKDMAELKATSDEALLARLGMEVDAQGRTKPIKKQQVKGAPVMNPLSPNPERLKEIADKVRAQGGLDEGPRPKAKKYHPLLAQGWRYCGGILQSPEEIQTLGLVEDEDQSEKETLG